MYRTWVILVHTFREAIVQPIYPLLLVVGAAILGIYASLPFFTFGEDTLMYKAVGLDVVLLIALLLALFAAARTVHEEIEDRTMLTLMSKPIGRGQVLIGKFLGLLCSSAVAVLVLGVVLALCVWLRVPGDFSLPANPVREDLATRLSALRTMHLSGLWPQLVLVWMQVGVLVAVAVAISTRFSIVVSLPAALLIYIGGNLMRFVDAATMDASGPMRGLGYVVTTVLPFLRVFDLTDLTVYGTLKIAGTEFAADPNATTVGSLWIYVLAAAGYFACYVAFVLSLGYASFRSRELGGNDG